MRCAAQSPRAADASKSRTCGKPDSSCELPPTAPAHPPIAFAIPTAARHCAHHRPLSGPPLEAARKRAKEMAAQVADGTNPIEVRNAEREAAPTRTFQALADRYLKEHAERHKRPRSVEEDRRNLAVHVLPRWAKRDFRTVRRADVIELIEAIVSAKKHTAANRVHSLISKVFSFAIDADLLEANPVAQL